MIVKIYKLLTWRSIHIAFVQMKNKTIVMLIKKARFSCRFFWSVAITSHDTENPLPSVRFLFSAKASSQWTATLVLSKCFCFPLILHVCSLDRGMMVRCSGPLMYWWSISALIGWHRLHLNPHMAYLQHKHQQSFVCSQFYKDVIVWWTIWMF